MEQVLKEAENSLYDNSASIYTSKKRLCINPDVIKNSKQVTINKQCVKLLNKRSCKYHIDDYESIS